MIELPQKFPRTYSGIIRIAVSDLQKVLATEGMKVNMLDWYHVNDSGMCEVCLGGAVLSQSAGFKSIKYSYFIEEHHNDEFLESVLYALDYLRKNDIDNFIGILTPFVTCESQCDISHQIDKYNHGDSGAKFIKQLLNLADKFEKVNM